jgi:hypothetical protein
VKKPIKKPTKKRVATKRVKRQLGTLADGQGCQREVAARARDAEENVRTLAAMARREIMNDDKATRTVPDLAFHFNFVTYGYEVHVFDNGQFVYAGCRDFGDDHKIDAIKAQLIDAIDQAVAFWRKKL